jgi:hypothetical protein
MDDTALTANEVMVTQVVRIVAGPPRCYLDPSHEFQLFEESKRPVYGVARYGRQPLAQAPVQGLSIWVLVASGDLAVDLRALMSHAQPAGPKNPLKSLQATLEQITRDA